VSANGLSRVQDLVLLHEALLSDRRRQRAFRQALARIVRPGCAVLDIGAGTGVWAIEAARLGAARVVAIEREALLLPVIERLARENGVADRLEIVHGRSREVKLAGRFDVVVAELVGHQGFDEDIVRVIADARARFLRPGGRIVPRALSLWAAPARLRGGTPAAANRLRLESFRELSVHCARVVPGRELATVAAPERLVRVDLSRAAPRAGRGEHRGRWRVPELARVDGLALWVEVTFAPGLTLSTRSGTHWAPTFLPLERLGRGPATLEGRVRLLDGPPAWEVRVASPGGGRTWRHSPLFAYGSLAPALRRGGRRGTANRSGA
jgi:SAM-dependent methyltransferase